MHYESKSQRHWKSLVLLLAAVALATSCGGGGGVAPAADGTPASLLLNTTSLDFGTVAVGSSKSSSLTLTNSSAPGGASITVSQMSVTGSAFDATMPNLPLVLTAGQSFNLTITFSPTANGAANGTASITVEGASQPATVPLTGIGSGPGQLSVNPTSMSFGNVSVGSSKSSPLVLTNSAAAGSQSISISQISVSGSAYSAVLPNLPLTLTAGQSFTLTVTFSPTAGGAASGNVTITVQGSTPPTTVPLSGTGIAPGLLTASPATLSFGNVNIGSSSNKTGTLTAGTTNITVASASWNGQGYSVSGITFPVTINAGQSLNYTVTFAPQAPGLSSGGVSFVSNASNSPTTQSFTGTGIQVQHSASLSWNASTSQVVGYNIYRSTQSGSYTTPLNPSPQAALTYTDTTVSSGVTYFYVATAVDSNSQESVPSNEVTAVIP